MIEGKLLGPLRPDVPTLKPGGKYLVEVVVRTLGVGHLFSQGTVDSNEIWVELIARSGDRVIGRSGGIGPDGTVDPYSHFINVYMLDRDGNRIDRRNPQDIFVPLYNKQIPPGAGPGGPFRARCSRRASRGPITLEAKVNYRKFDRTYLDYIFGKGKGPTLPVVVMARDQVSLPIDGGPPAANDPSPIEATWQRWNDYGIGLFLEGATKGGQKGELKQAEVIFTKVAELGRADGWVNLARVYQREGRIPDALAALEKAASHKEPAAPWVINWLTGQINASNGMLDDAIASFESVLATKIPARKFDFSTDYRVINDLGAALYARARIELPVTNPARRDYLQKAIAAYRRTLAIDSEDVGAHWGLAQAYSDPAWGKPTKTSRRLMPASPAPATKAEPADPDALVKLAASIADPEVRRGRAPVAGVASGSATSIGSWAARVRAISRGWSRCTRWSRSSAPPGTAAETDPETLAALAQALKVTHRQLHERLKPDETAEGRAFRLARQRDPAANLNAQSIVIHPLHRPGAPGIDQPVTTASPTPIHSKPRPPPPTRPPLRSTKNDLRITALVTSKYAELAALVLLVPCGCSPGTAKPVLPKAVAPVRPVAVKAEALPTVKFVDITKDAGINFVHNNGAFGDKLLPETMGSGVAFLDYDGDGDQDLFFVNSSYWPNHEVKPAPTQALYRNDGKGHFEDVTKEAGLDKTFYGQGVAVGDYDNDGDPDLYVTSIGRGYLFRNDGKGHFDDVTVAANAKGPNGWLTGAAFLDIDNDGDLDLFIGNYITWTP